MDHAAPEPDPRRQRDRHRLIETRPSFDRGAWIGVRIRRREGRARRRRSNAMPRSAPIERASISRWRSAVGGGRARGGGMIHRFGSPEQRAAWLAPVAGGEILASFALTEEAGERTPRPRDHRRPEEATAGSSSVRPSSRTAARRSPACTSLPRSPARCGLTGLSTFLVQPTQRVSPSAPHRKLGGASSDTPEFVRRGARRRRAPPRGTRTRLPAVPRRADRRPDLDRGAVGRSRAGVSGRDAWPMRSERQAFGRKIGAIPADPRASSPTCGPQSRPRAC